MPLEREECAHCGEEILVVMVKLKDGSVVLRGLQIAEVEAIGEDGVVHRGHERHWKYCSARPTTGTVSAEPPEDEPDNPLTE